MMKRILRTTISLLIVFIVGFTAGMALSKYRKTNIEHENLIKADIQSRK